MRQADVVRCEERAIKGEPDADAAKAAAVSHPAARRCAGVLGRRA
jgi:hypothetical protein